MRHSKKTWEAMYDSIPGTPSNKSIELLIEYSKISFGLLGGAWGTARSAVNRFFTLHWNRHHADLVQTLLKPYLEERALEASDFSDVLSAEAKSPGYLIFAVRDALSKANQPVNPNGDLATLLQIIKEKNNLTEEQIHDLQGARLTPHF